MGDSITNINKSLLTKYLDIIREEYSESKVLQSKIDLIDFLYFSQNVRDLFDENEFLKLKISERSDELDDLESNQDYYKNEIHKSHLNNQLSIQKYEQSMEDNKQLKKVNAEQKELNKNLNNKLNILNTKLKEYNINISSLSDDNDFYNNLLNEMNILLDSDVKEDELIDSLENIIDIKNSPNYKIIDESDLFDKTYYRDNYLDDDTDPIEHYLLIGASLGYSTSPNFNSLWYINKHEEVKKSNLNPLIYYLLFGKDKHESLVPRYDSTLEETLRQSHEYQIINDSDVFDKQWYLQEYDISDSIDITCHYLIIGQVLNYKPNEEFNVNNYIEEFNLDNENPVIHYLANNWSSIAFEENNEMEPFNIEECVEYTLIKESGLFDENYYYETYKDIHEKALEHFIRYGYRENRKPNENFNVYSYYKEYPSLKEDNINPLIHYILNQDYSIEENVSDVSSNNSEDYELLKNSKYFDSENYLKYNPNLKATDDPIEYFIEKGYKEEYLPSKYFNHLWYNDKNWDVKNNDINPLIHYLKVGKKESRPARWQMLNIEEIPEYKDDEELIDCYYEIYESTIFNLEYYLEQTSDVTYDEKLDPILHYILYGVDEGLDPSPFFSTSRYLEVNPDIKEEQLNPLYHFLISGTVERRPLYLPVDEELNKFDNKYPLNLIKNYLDSLKNKISIIVHVNGSLDEIKACIKSIFQNTHLNHDLILVKDDDVDEKTGEYLSNLVNYPNIKLIDEGSNLINKINQAITESDGDAVILRNNAIVTHNWLNHLLFAAYERKQIGSVTPISNFINIPLEKFEYLDDISVIFNKISNNELSKINYTNINCIFLKKDVIGDVGLFDESSDDYVNDYCSRMTSNGWINVCDDSTYIYTADNSDFSVELCTYESSKYPKLLKLDADLDALNKSISNIKDNINSDLSETLLYITTLDNNNKPVITDNFNKLIKEYEVYVLALSDNTMIISKYIRTNFPILRKWNIGYDWTVDQFIKIFFNLLKNLKIDLIDVISLKDISNKMATRYSLCLYLADKLSIPLTYDSQIKEYIPVLSDKSYDELLCQKSNLIDFEDKKCVVYTAICSNYHNLQTPDYINPEFDYVCFTDNPDLISDFWEIRLMDDLDLNKNDKIRYYKILSHKYLKEYDYSFWFDSDIVINGNLAELINQNTINKDLIAFKHEQYDNISKYPHSNELTSKINHYLSEGYPRGNDLARTNVLFRNHNNQDVTDLMKKWYDEFIETGSDILSFNYVSWKNNFKLELCSLDYNINPFFHKIPTKQNDDLLIFNEKTVNNILDSFDDVVSIIIPIYNAYDETKACIESVFEYTNIPFELVLINDCSPDERIAQLLDEYDSLDNVKVITNETNMGFVKNVNIGFNESGGDVVLLNSDTIVTPKWLEKLKVSAYQRENIATVTPVSNNAGAFSVPEFNKNELNGLSINTVANIVEKSLNNQSFTVPTGNGFCLYIKREAIYSVGFFDEVFGRGYCEENDFCMRLIKNGWQNIIEPSVYIYHAHNVSFSTEKEKLLKKNRKILDQKHPDYSKRVRNFINSYHLENIHNVVGRRLKSSYVNKFDRKRVLYVIHEGTGGTLHTSIDLMKEIQKDMDTYILTVGDELFSLYKYNEFIDYHSDEKSDDEFMNKLILISQWKIKTKLNLEKIFYDEFRAVYFNLLVSLNIDIVHIRHMIRQSLDLPYVAKKLGIPVVLSFHDFYYVCPSHNLLDNEGHYCGGHCTSVGELMPYKDLKCKVVAKLHMPITKTFVGQWRKYMHDMFRQCSAFVTTSRSTYDIYTEFYPELKNRQFEVIEHGRNLTTPDDIDKCVTPISEDKPIKIVFPGHLSFNKGGNLIQDIKKLDKDNKLEFHYMGALDGKLELEKYGINHGFYNRSEFCKIIHDIKPHLIGILSVWPETYCHTLTEAWSCGIPVLTIDIGALGERVHDNGGGFFVDNDPKKAYEQIIEISRNPEEYIRVANDIPSIKFKSTEQMGKDYMKIYEKFLPR